MSNRSKRTPGADAEPGFRQSCLIKWSKGLQLRAKWDKESFEDFPVCVHWFRQITSVIVGIGLGLAGIIGAPGLVGGFGFITVLTSLYYARYIEADEFSYSETGLKMEGMLPSFAVFILAWTTSFTAMGHGLNDPMA